MEPLNNPPYNNLVTAECPELQGNHSSEFDCRNKTIHIVEAMGPFGAEETWAKLVNNVYTAAQESFRVVRKVKSEYYRSDETGGLFYKERVYEYDERTGSLKFITEENQLCE